MPSAPTERRLAAILSADAAGYSRLMAEDEAGTIQTLTDYREAIAMLVRQHRGRVVDSPGDNVLAEFPTALDAVRAAAEIQRVIRARNADLPAPRRMEFRIGVHLGDVAAEGQRIYGDGVNIAARLEGLAEPGGLCVSDAVCQQVRGKLDLSFEDMGEQTVKNIPQPVRVHRALLAEAREGPPPPPSGRGRRLLVRAALVLAGAAALVAVVLWLSWPRPLGWVLDAAGLGALPENPPLPDLPSVVVLPFLNLSDDPEQEYLADGITEEVTADLAGIPFIFVISRSSAFTYKGASANVAEVSRELGVRYVVEGSVRRVGERVRVTAQLIDATRDVHVWSDRYDRALGDLLDLQSEISEQILGALGVEIHEAEFARLRRKPTQSLSAYEAFIRGLGHWRKVTREGFAEARSHFERAIELDPEFAAANAALAASYAIQAGVRCPRDLEPPPRVREAALRALALDPFDAATHATLALLALWEGRTEDGLAAAERAVELAPGWDAVYFTLGNALLQSGRPLEAIGPYRRALRLSPRPPAPFLGMLGTANYIAGRHERAVALWERVRATNPDLIPARVMLADHYESSGEHEKARGVVEEILRGNPDCTADAAVSFLANFLGPEATRELRDRLVRAGLPEVAQPADDPFTVPGFSGAPAIAVLPFDNMSADPDQEYFADGLAEELITRLTVRGNFPVIARNSSFRYRGGSVDVKQVSRELGVRYVVEGSVRKAEGRVRMSVQLIDATTGRHVWAETYDRELREIFALHDEVTEALVGAINPALMRAEAARVARREPESLDAYDHCMRGVWHLFKRTEEDSAKARALFESAIEIDPEWALPFFGLSTTHYVDVLFQWSDRPDRSIEAALRAAQRCAALDHAYHNCQIALSWAYSLAGQREEAIAAAETAIRLNPSAAGGHFALGLFLGLTGRPDDGIAHLEKAIRLSPQDVRMGYFLSGIALAHFAAGRYEEAVEWAQRSLGRDPSYYSTYATLAASHAHLGHVDAAGRAVREMLRRNPEFSPDSLRKVFAIADRALIESWLDGLRKAGLKG